MKKLKQQSICKIKFINDYNITSIIKNKVKLLKNKIDKKLNIEIISFLTLTNCLI